MTSSPKSYKLFPHQIAHSMAMFGFRRRAKSAVASTAAPEIEAGSRPTPATPGQPGALYQTLSWTIIRRLDGIFQGDHETLFHGTGMRMSDIREYQAGDDVRHLDWNVSARTGALHIRTFYEERELTAWFLIDTSESLAFQSAGLSKRQMARQAVETLAGLLVRHGDRIAAMLDRGLGNTPLRLLPPGSGQSHVIRLLDMMEMHREDSVPPTSRPARKASAAQEGLPSSTQLTPMLERALAVIRRRSLVIIVSDFWVASGWEAALRRLAHRHDVLCIQITDPQEMQLPNVGMLTIQDSESGEQILVDTGDAITRARYDDIMKQRQEKIAQTCALAGADLLQIQTNQSLLRQLMGYLAFRKKRRALSGARASR
jgi:uncharacterized protein (DUF58 family)